MSMKGEYGVSPRSMPLMPVPAVTKPGRAMSEQVRGARGRDEGSNANVYARP